MTDEASETAAEAEDDARLRGAVIAGVVPGQSPRVLKEAARYAKLHSAPLAVVHVDVTRFVTYEDPDGYVHSAPIDMNIAAGEGELTKVRDAAASLLEATDLTWEVRQLVGD